MGDLFSFVDKNAEIFAMEIHTRCCAFMLTFLWLNVASQLDAQDDKLEDRLAFLQLERNDLDQKKMSVLIEKYRVSESVVLGGARLSGDRILQRYMCDGRAKVRIDAIKLNALGDEDINKSLTEAEIVTPVKGIHYRGKFPADQKFLAFEVRAGVMAVDTFSCRKHPFEIATTSATGNRKDGDNNSMLEISPKNKKIIEEKVLPDGRSYWKFYVSNDAAIGLTFNKDESWCIEQMECFADDSNLSNTLESDAKKLKMYASTRSQWKKNSDDQLLPSRVFLESDDNGKESWEIRFADWKFGDQVDTSLFDEVNFTEEKIKKSIDFRKVKKMFDDLPK
ncbi:MAG: hypothetical protein NTY15_04440 [Planctomycetota bacterium]|nr:hypothetical protein [Planctomycetota bacterium]